MTYSKTALPGADPMPQTKCQRKGCSHIVIHATDDPQTELFCWRHYRPRPERPRMPAHAPTPKPPSDQSHRPAKQR